MPRVMLGTPSGSKDNDHHWHECNNANCDAVKDKAEHSWDDGEVTTSPTCTTAGEKTFTCTACSATRKETIPATGHAWDTEWSKDNDHHWHECNNANCDAVKDKAEHSWDDGEVTTSPTCTTAGEKDLLPARLAALQRQRRLVLAATPGAQIGSRTTATKTITGMSAQSATKRKT